MIVRGRYAGDTQEGEEVLLLRAGEVCSQGLGGFEGERPLTDSLQLLGETTTLGTSYSPPVKCMLLSQKFQHDTC